MRTISLGYENYIPEEMVVYIGDYTASAFQKRLMSDAKDASRLIDCSKNKKVKSIVVMKDGYIALSILKAATLVSRLNEEDQK